MNLNRLNLEAGQEVYLRECLAAGRRFFVTRKRSNGRCIQASGETLEGVKRCHANWPNSSLIEITDGKIIWHKL